MSSPSTVLSKTLQSITTTKIRELRKQRDVFETWKAKVLEDYARSKDHESGIRVLLAGLEGSGGSTAGISEGLNDYDSRDPELGNIHRFLDQSRYDPSMSSPMLQAFATGLRRRLDQQSRKFDYADLYSRLLLEWLHPSGNPIADSPTTDERGLLDGAFQLVERDRLQQLRDKFEAVVFEPIVTDEIEIDKYMSSMFPEDDDEASRALRDLRETIKSFTSGASGLVRALSVFLSKNISAVTQGAISFFIDLFVFFYAITLAAFLRRSFSTWLAPTSPHSCQSGGKRPSWQGWSSSLSCLGPSWQSAARHPAQHRSTEEARWTVRKSWMDPGLVGLGRPRSSKRQLVSSLHSHFACERWLGFRWAFPHRRFGSGSKPA